MACLDVEVKIFTVEPNRIRGGNDIFTNSTTVQIGEGCKRSGGGLGGQEDSLEYSIMTGPVLGRRICPRWSLAILGVPDDFQTFY